MRKGREAALGVGGGYAAVAGGDLLGELGQGFLAGGAVDADALAGVACGEDVSGGFPAAVLALVDGAVAVGADPARARYPRVGWDDAHGSFAVLHGGELPARAGPM